MARSDGASGERLGDRLSAVNASRTDARPPIPATLRGRIDEFETRVAPPGSDRANAGWTFARNNFLGNHPDEAVRTRGREARAWGACCCPLCARRGLSARMGLCARLLRLRGVRASAARLRTVSPSTGAEKGARG
jgi:hypothetical protein